MSAPLSTASAGGGEEKSASDLGEYVANKSLARCRQARSVSRAVLIHNLPSLRDAAPSQRQRLFKKKLRLCSYIFEFGTESADPEQDGLDKELKRTTLLDLINFLSIFKPAFTDDQLGEIFEMIYLNLFRPLPANGAERRTPYAPEDEDDVPGPSWMHLQVVYEFLLRLATATETDSKLLDRYFSQSFVLGLLELFDSEDIRERDYLKTILHRIYGNFMSLRPFIRRSINNIFFRLIYETDRHNGVAELLEILGSIINGFALPLKDQHKQFLAKVLLPLHKVSRIDSFHAQLSYCVTQFIDKDPTLASGIILALLKVWPQTAHKKELMLLNEVEEVLYRVHSRYLGDAQIPLFRQLARCIHSPHFQVSERAIYILSNEVMVRFVATHRQTLFPVLADALFSNTHLANGGVSPTSSVTATGEPSTWVPGASTRPHGHWNATIVELTADVLKTFGEMDAATLRACKDHFDATVQTEIATRTVRAQRWAAVTAMGAAVAERLAKVHAANAKARGERALGTFRPIPGTNWTGGANVPTPVAAPGVTGAAAAAAANGGVVSGAQMAQAAAAAGTPLTAGYRRS